jgi:hypothetical protein
MATAGEADTDEGKKTLHAVTIREGKRKTIPLARGFTRPSKNCSVSVLCALDLDVDTARQV